MERVCFAVEEDRFTGRKDEEGSGDLGRTRRGGRMRQWSVLVLLLRSLELGKI